MARNVLITGSSHGIGAAADIAFAKEGCNVGITYHKNPEGAEETARECRKYGVRAKIYQVDVSKHDQCRDRCGISCRNLGKLTCW